jgi:protein required for attachment to host cells
MKPANFTTWILVSNASQARILAGQDATRAFSLVEEFSHPQSREKGIDVLSDRPGRVLQRTGLGERSAMEPDQTPREIEAEHFARALAERLERGLQDHAFSRLAIVAPPHFLGLLRQQLSKDVEKHLVVSLDKDYTQVEPRELPDLLPEVA